MERIPAYMNKGSKGPLVTLLQAFLCGVIVGSSDLVYDQEYGGVTAGLVNHFQVIFDIEADGNFGPATRAHAKSAYGFDFEAAANSIPGETSFVQPDGKIIVWRSPSS